LSLVTGCPPQNELDLDSARKLCGTIKPLTSNHDTSLHPSAVWREHTHYHCPRSQPAHGQPKPRHLEPRLCYMSTEAYRASRMHFGPAYSRMHSPYITCTRARGTRPTRGIPEEGCTPATTTTTRAAAAAATSYDCCCSGLDPGQVLGGLRGVAD